MVRDSAAWHWVPELVPAPGEHRVHKRFNSSFEQTGLVEWLQAQGATHLVLAGAASNWCIRATAYAALERGFHLTLASDAHTTESMVLDGDRRIEAKDIVADLNIAMRWLAYPGRPNAAVPAAEVDFAVPVPTA